MAMADFARIFGERVVVQTTMLAFEHARTPQAPRQPTRPKLVDVPKEATQGRRRSPYLMRQKSSSSAALDAATDLELKRSSSAALDAATDLELQRLEGLADRETSLPPQVAALNAMLLKLTDESRSSDEAGDRKSRDEDKGQVERSTLRKYGAGDHGGSGRLGCANDSLKQPLVPTKGLAGSEAAKPAGGSCACIIL